MTGVAQFLRAYSHALSSREEQARLKRQCQTPIIVSREIGSGGRLVAEELARRLGFQLCDKAILEEISARTKTPPDIVALLDERPAHALELFGASLLRGTSITQEEFERHLKYAIQTFLQLGSVVILGRGAAFLVEPGKALRLRIVAPIEMRVAAIAESDQISQRQALEKLHKIEAERRQFYRLAYGRDEMEPYHFDITLNRQCFSIQQMAELALQAHRTLCEVPKPEP
jgi:cytidylate kinase